VIALVVRLTAWLLIGATALSGLYWLFLNTPETNALTLSASAGLLLAILILTALVVNAAVLMGGGAPFLSSLIQGLRGTLWFIAVLVPLAAIWWALTAAHTWTTDHSGEINAWFIARFGWANISPLLTTEMWIVRWLSWVVAPLAAVSLLAAVLDQGARGFRDRWLRRAWHWRTLLLATLVFVLLFVLPWQLTTWRPPLPATWVEPTVAGIRLFAVMLLWALGAALLVLLSISGRSAPPRVTPSTT
jgi:hypothetical protein